MQLKSSKRVDGDFQPEKSRLEPKENCFWWFLSLNFQSSGINGFNFLLLEAITGLMVPLNLYLVKNLLDSMVLYMNGEPCKQVLFWFGLFIFFLTLEYFINIARPLAYNSFYKKRMANLNQLVMDKALLYPLEQFSKETLANEYSYLKVNLQYYSDSSLEVFSTLLNAFFAIVGSVFILASVSLYIPLIIFSVAVINALIRKTNEKELGHFREREKSERKLENYTKDLLLEKKYAKEIRLFNLQDYLSQKYSYLYWQGQKNEYDMMIKISLREMVAALFVLAASGLVLFISVNSYWELVSVGYLAALILGICGICYYTEAVFSQLLSLKEINRFSFLLRKFFQNTPPSASSIFIPIEISEPVSIEARNISFKYPHTKEDVLKDISFRIRPKEKVLILGEENSGKSSLAKILSGVYLPTLGEVLLGGINLANIQSDKKASYISGVWEDFQRYPFSIAENIALEPIDQMDSKKLFSMLKDIGLDLDSLFSSKEEIYQLFSTESSKVAITENQWQRIALARCFYRDPLVVIFDEPTKDLDPIAELKIMTRFLTMAKEKSAIIFSHRCGIAEYVDTIYFLQNGIFREKGSHEELLNLGGAYAKLFAKQKRWYR